MGKQNWNSKLRGGQEGDTAPAGVVKVATSEETGFMGMLNTPFWGMRAWVWIIIILVIIIIIVASAGGLWWWQSSEGMSTEAYIPGTPPQVDMREMASQNAPNKIGEFLRG